MWTFAARAVTRLASAAGLLTLMVGIPIGQLRYIGWPLPDHTTTAAELRTALTSRGWLTDTALLNSLAVLLWLLWVLFVVSVLVEVSASIRGVRAPRYRLLAPTQGIAAALVAGLTATIVAAAPAPALSHSPLTPAAHTSGPAAALVVVPAVHPSTAAPANTPWSKASHCGASPTPTWATPTDGPRSGSSTRASTGHTYPAGPRSTTQT